MKPTRITTIKPSGPPLEVFSNTSSGVHPVYQEFYRRRTSSIDTPAYRVYFIIRTSLEKQKIEEVKLLINEDEDN